MTTTGAPPGAAGGRWHARVWALAGPIILSNLSTPLLGAVDTAVVGHLPDPAYIGGVAVGAVVFSFLYWGFGFLRMGTTGFTAQAFGAGDADELRAALGRALLLALVLGSGLIVLQAPIGWVAFRLFEAGAVVEGFAESYYAIRIWSAPAALANYAMLGWLLGTGRAGAVLLLQVALNGINIALDLAFVLVLGWGVEGVAAASLVAEVAAAVWGLAIIARALKAAGGRVDRRRLLDRARLAALLRVNLDILVRTLCLLSAFAYHTAQGAKLGEVTLAANAILMHFLTMAAYALDGFAHAVEVLAGNALGAASRAAFRRVVRVSTAWALAVAALITLVYLAFGGTIIGLFTNIEAVRNTAETYLPWLVVLPLVAVWSFQLDGIFVGTTRTADMRNAMIVTLAIYLAACWVLIPRAGNHGLWLCMIILMTARALTLGVFYPRLERSVARAPKRSTGPGGSPVDL